MAVIARTRGKAVPVGRRVPPRSVPPPPPPNVSLPDPMAAYGDLPIPGSLQTFRWGGKAYGAGDRAAFQNYLAQRRVPFASWAARNPRQAKVFSGPSMYDVANAAAMAAVKPSISGLEADRVAAQQEATRRTSANNQFNVALTSLLGRQVPVLTDLAGDAAASQAALARGLGNTAETQQAAETQAGSDWLSQVAGAPAENIASFADALKGREATTYGMGGYIPAEEMRQTFMGAAQEAAQRAYGGGGVPSVPVALRAAENAQILTSKDATLRDIRAKELEARLTGAANVPTIMNQIQAQQAQNAQLKMQAYTNQLERYKLTNLSPAEKWQKQQELWARQNLTKPQQVEANQNWYRLHNMSPYEAAQVEADKWGRGNLTAAQQAEAKQFFWPYQHMTKEQQMAQGTSRMATLANIEYIHSQKDENKANTRAIIAGISGYDQNGNRTLAGQKLDADTAQNNRILDQNLTKINATVDQNKQAQMHNAVADWTATMTGLISNTDMAKVPYSSLRTTAYTAAVTAGIPSYITGTPTQKKKAVNAMIDGWLKSRVPPSAAKGTKAPRTVEDFRQGAVKIAQDAYTAWDEANPVNEFGHRPSGSDAAPYFSVYRGLMEEYLPKLLKKGFSRKRALEWIQNVMLQSGFTSTAQNKVIPTKAGAQGTTSSSTPATGGGLGPPR